MTSYTKKEFRDALLAFLYEAIKDDPYTDELKIVFEDIYADAENSEENAPAASESWIQIIIKHNTSAQSLSGASGSRRFERNGFVTVNVYTPSGDGLNANDLISEIITKIFETSNISIWFRNTNSAEIGKYRSWFLTSVTSEFEYDQIRQIGD